MTFQNAFILAAALLGALPAAAKAPAAPTSFKVKPLGANAFQLDWKDNSDNETGWEISISLGVKDTAERFTLLPRADINSYVVITNDLPNKTLTFQLAAYNGAAGAEKFSKRTKPVVIKSLGPVKFGNPANLKSKTLDDGRIRLTWKDQSTTEHGYQIQFRKGGGKWKDYSFISPGAKFNMVLPGFSPATPYSFRVRAYMDNPFRVTDFSNVSTTRTKGFRRPEGLVATAVGEGSISLKWKDRSAIEAGYEIESSTGNGQFSKLGEVGANVTGVDPIPGFALSSNVKLRVRAFRQGTSGRVYSSYSNVGAVDTPPIFAPTHLAGSSGDSSVQLTWKDESSRETFYQIVYRKVGDADYLNGGLTFANSTGYTVTGLEPATNYEFLVGAQELFGTPSYSPAVQVTTKHGIVGNLKPAFVANDGFLYRIQFSSKVNLTSVDVTGLPSGLSYDAANHMIIGSAGASGTYTVTLTAHYSDGTVSTRSLVLKVITGAPETAGSFASVNVAVGAVEAVSLDGRFTDPDTPEAVRFHTSKGDFDVILFPDSTPVTVANFLDYVGEGRYTDMFFHRAPQDFVVQGGGFRHTSADGFTQIPTFPQIQNEAGYSNVRGTVAMAKLSDQPNSATSQFFVNIGDNSLNLDSQNGGFAVFGRVPDSEMPVFDAINALPKSNYTIDLGGSPLDLENVPIDAASAPAVLDPAQLVKVTSVENAPILTYDATSNNPGVATAALSPDGTKVDITGVASGSTTITVKATDLDGKSVTQDIPVTVP